MSVSSQVVSGLRWTVAAKLSAQVVTWVLTIYVVRLLDPADYGLMSMAMLSVGFLSVLNDLGLGAAIVQRRNIDDDLLRQTYSLLIVIGLALFLILLLFAPLLAKFFDDPRLTIVVRVLAIQFLILPFEVIPNALLLRDMLFKKISIIDLVTRIISGLIAFGFAVNGFGIYALIFASLGSVILRAIVFNIVSPFLKLPSLSLRGMRSMLSFGGLVTLDRLLWFLYSQADILIIGKLLNTQMLGFYAVAMHLASLPMQKFNSIINQVSLPAFSVIQENPGLATFYLKKAIRILNLISFPTFFGIASIAPEIVPVLLGDQWQPAVVPIVFLSIIMPVLMTSYLFPAVLRSRGRADISVINLAVACIIMPIAFFVGSAWGLLGVSLAWVLAYPIVFLIEIKRSRLVTGLGVRDIVNEMAKPAYASAVMYIIVASLRHLRIVDSSVLAVVMEIATGAAVFLFVILLIDKESVREAYNFVRS